MSISFEPLGSAAPADERDPAALYRQRIAGEQDLIRRCRRGERWLLWARSGALFAVAAVGYRACGQGPLSAHWIWAPVLLVIALSLWLGRIDARLRRHEVRIAYFEMALARVEERWQSQGDRGEEFVDPRHQYTGDLDVFGAGGLFALLCTARTSGGRQTLAAWLTRGATAEDVARRQEAVRDLADRPDLRDDLWECGGLIQAEVRSSDLAAWVEAPTRLVSKPVRLLGLCLGLGAIPALWALSRDQIVVAALVFGGQVLYAWRFRAITAEVARSAFRRSWELKTVAALVTRLESAAFTSPLLQQIARELAGDGLRARHRVQRLVRWVELIEARRNLYFAFLTAPLMLGTQLSLAVEGWRHRHGSVVSRWIKAVGTIEALSALATFAFEHPTFAFPEVVADAARPFLEGRGLAHPLLPAATRVGNDIELGAVSLLLVTGSNMSGKSTLLRTVGTNAVLALAGAPVCAESMRLPYLSIGASIRATDSLQEGVSRFFAEIKRLRDVVGLVERSPFTLYLLDEILQGTNSHDRQVGGESLISQLSSQGAIGFITTHDLALARLADELAPRARNVHLEDRIENERLLFDYRLREGVVRGSNALDLMRLVGLRV